MAEGQRAVAAQLPSGPRDPHRFSTGLDAAMLERLIARLESRGKDRVFTRLFEKYAAKLPLAHGTQLLEIGCGTGVVARAFARRQSGATLVAIDQSAAFIEAAQDLAAREGLAEAIDFRVGDAHALPLDAACFDIAVAHTLISHVTDPAAVLAEAKRVLRPGGRLVVFDGDYASLTYAFADADEGRRMEWALARAAFNNPIVMRRLPVLLADTGFQLRDTAADVVYEMGGGSYFRTMAETYAPMIPDAGLAPAEAVERWLDAQRRAMAEERFFASCNYFSVIAERS